MSTGDQGRTDILAALVAEMRLERRGGTRAMIGLLTVITLAVGIGVVFLGSRESSGIRAEAKVDAYSVSLIDAQARVRVLELKLGALQRDLLKGKFPVADDELLIRLQEMRDEPNQADFEP